MEALAIYMSERDIAIAAHKKALADSEAILQEADEILESCKLQMEAINQEILNIGAATALREQSLASLKAQCELASKKFNESEAYAEAMRHTALYDQAIAQLMEAQRVLLDSDRLYKRALSDHDQSQAGADLRNRDLGDFHAELMDTLAKTETRKINLQAGMRLTQKILEELLFENAQEQILVAQQEVFHKREELDSAEQFFAHVVDQEIAGLHEYPELQRQARNLVPVVDGTTKVLELAITLLKTWINEGRMDTIPTRIVKDLFGYQADIPDMLTWNTYNLAIAVNSHFANTIPLQEHIKKLEQVLNQYQEAKHE